MEGRVDWNMEIGIREIYGGGPFALLKLGPDRLRSFHAESPASDELVEGLQVDHRPESSSLLGNQEQVRVESRDAGVGGNQGLFVQESLDFRMSRLEASTGR